MYVISSILDFQPAQPDTVWQYQIHLLPMHGS